MAASTKIVAAVVKPTSPPASRKIAPAPRKPIPCTKLEGKNGEQRRAHANKSAGANPSGPPVQIALNSNRGAQQRCKTQAQEHFMERDHWIARVLLATTQFYYLELELR